MTIVKRTQVTNVGDDVEKREPSGLIDGNVHYCIHCENSMAISQKLEIELPYNTASPPWAISENQRH